MSKPVTQLFFYERVEACQDEGRAKERGPDVAHRKNER